MSRRSQGRSFGGLKRARPKVERGGRNAAGFTIEEWYEQFHRQMFRVVRDYVAKKRYSAHKIYDHWDDFVSVGQTALIEAFHDFDPSRGMKPNSFVGTKVLWELKLFAQTGYLAFTTPISGMRNGLVASKRKAILDARAKYVRERGCQPPPSWYAQFSSTHYKTDRVFTTAASAAQSDNPYMKQVQRTNRFANQVLTIKHNSCDAIVPNSEGERNPVREVDLLADGDADEHEEGVEKKVLADKVMKYLRDRYTDSEIALFMEWLDSQWANKELSEKQWSEKSLFTRTARRKRMHMILNDLKAVFASG